MIPWQTVTDLCELGRLGEPGSPEALVILERLAPWDEVNRQHWHAWNTVADALDTADLINLVRGLLLAEEALHWLGGSVSGVIWTYQALQRRDSYAAGLVSEWGRDRTTNFWVPFRKRTPRELESRSKASAAETEADTQKKELEHERVKQRRIEHARLMVKHIATRTETAREREILLNALAGRPLSDRLRAVARDKSRALSWFPETWATEAMVIVTSLDPLLRDEMIDRLEGHRKGPWRHLRQFLVEAKEDR